MTSGVQIPLNDLGRATTAHRPEIDAAVARVLDRGYYVLGPENAALEQELTAYLGGGEVVPVGNGTDALQLALTALGVTTGSRVVTVANAGGYTSTAARALGAELVYADVDPLDQLMTLETFEEAVSAADGRPAVVVVTHLFGGVADIQPIVDRAGELGIRVLEDCAQALGASRGGRKAGTFGDIATASFYPTKNLGALGDGGAVITSSPELAATVRRLRQYGWESKYSTTVAGGANSRLDEVQAAILRVKLPHLDAGNERRRAIHARYESALGAGARFVTRSTEGSIGHLAVIEVDDREAVRESLHEVGIRTDIHYPIPDHRQPLVDRGPDPRLAVTEAAAQRILSVPLFPELEDDEVDRICDALGRIV